VQRSVLCSFAVAARILNATLPLAACLLVAASAHATAILQGNTWFTSTQSTVMDGVINWAVFDDYADIAALAGDYVTLAGAPALATSANYFYLYQFTNAGPSQLGSTYVAVNVFDISLISSAGWFSGWGFTDNGVPISAVPDINNPENLGDDTLASPGVPRPGGSVGFTFRGANVLDPSPTGLWVGVNPWPSGVTWIQQWIPASASCPGCIPDSPILVMTSNAAPIPYETAQLRNQSGWSSFGDVPAPVPEPSTALLVALGLSGLALGRRSMAS
jgi:hypothetical protein